MVTWTLVLAMYLPGHYGALTTVPGFKSAAACMQAGDGWKVSIGSSSVVHAHCIRVE